MYGCQNSCNLLLLLLLLRRDQRVINSEEGALSLPMRAVSVPTPQSCLTKQSLYKLSPSVNLRRPNAQLFLSTIMFGGALHLIKVGCGRR